GPGADQMQWAKPARPVAGTPQGFAINSDHFVMCGSGPLPQALEPTNQALLQCQRTNRLEDAPKGIVRGDAVVQFQEASEEGFLGAAELLDFDEIAAAAQHATKADGQDIDQGMPQVLALAAWIRHKGKRFHQVGSLRRRHGASSVTVMSPRAHFMRSAELRQRKTLFRSHPMH